MFDEAGARIMLAKLALRAAERRAVTFRLLQGETDRLHAVEAGALGEIFVGDLAVLQVGEFRRRQGELLSERNRLRADFGGDLAERHLDRHAGLDADQQQIERIGKRALDR